MRIAWTALSLLLLTAPAIAQDASSSALPSAFSGSAPSSSLEPASSNAAPAPAGLSDADLELAVRAAYAAALDFAAAHDNYFARDGVVEPLRAAIAEALASAYPSVVVPDAAVDGDAAKACLTAPGTTLRVASNVFGDGLWLTAVTDTRLFSYTYDPHKSAEVVVQAATACSR